MQKSNLKNLYKELVIIGGGPAGISAGIYACMDKSNFLLLEAKSSCEFMEESINSHYFVEGFTGIKKEITGTELRINFIQHFKRLKGTISKEKVLSLNKSNSKFIIITSKRKIISNSVIICSGTKPRKLDIFNKYEKSLNFYCTKTGKKFIGKTVLVIGGRNSGVVAACCLHDLGCKVYLIEIQEEIQAKIKYKRQLFNRKIKVFTDSHIQSVKKNNSVFEIELKDKNQKYKISVNGIFHYAGRVPDLDFCKVKIKKDNNGYITTDYKGETSITGLFSAGDVTNRLKQVITACGDGANAYYFAKKYLDKEKSTK